MDVEAPMYWWFVWTSFHGKPPSPRLKRADATGKLGDLGVTTVLAKHRLSDRMAENVDLNIFRLDDLARFYPPPKVEPPKYREVLSDGQKAQRIVIRELQRSAQRLQARVEKGRTEIEKNGWTGYEYTGDARLAERALEDVKMLIKEVSEMDVFQ